jgi:hypothetical protein
MKKICVIFIIFFICAIGKTVTDSNNTIVPDSNDSHRWSGFRGLKWGVNIKDMNDPNMILVEKAEKDDGTVYRRANDKLSIGRAELSGLAYCCYKGRFFGILIGTDGLSNFQYLKDATFAYYGKGYQPNEYIEKWYWGDAFSFSAGVKDVLMSLEYNEYNKKGQLFMNYRPIQKEIKANDDTKAKEADKDFK